MPWWMKRLNLKKYKKNKKALKYFEEPSIQEAREYKDNYIREKLVPEFAKRLREIVNDRTITPSTKMKRMNKLIGEEKGKLELIYTAKEVKSPFIGVEEEIFKAYDAIKEEEAKRKKARKKR